MLQPKHITSFTSPPTFPELPLSPNAPRRPWKRWKWHSVVINTTDMTVVHTLHEVCNKRKIPCSHWTINNQWIKEPTLGASVATQQSSALQQLLITARDWRIYRRICWNYAIQNTPCSNWEFTRPGEKTNKKSITGQHEFTYNIARTSLGSDITGISLVALQKQTNKQRSKNKTSNVWLQTA